MRALFLITSFALFSFCCADYESFEYVFEDAFFQLPNISFDKLTATAVDSVGRRIYVAQRDARSPLIFIFDMQGHFVSSWPLTTSIQTIHGIKGCYDQHGKFVLWIADMGQHVVRKFDQNGQMILSLGTLGKAGRSLYPLQFDAVADIACGQDRNSIYVSDGDAGMNNRVIELHAETGEIRYVWGVNGTSSLPGYFHSPHSVAVAFSQKRLRSELWVADRGNNRTQIFDAHSGEYLSSWTCMTPTTPWAIRIDNVRHRVIIATAALEDQQAPLSIGRLVVLPFETSSLAPDECTIGFSFPFPFANNPHEIEVDEITGDIFVAAVLAPTQLYRFRFRK
eukprot:TRINITY_DN5395_c0_g1_i1.p1 TRINITY_DN5395_c0_g1~~TRINITY_DN5395_c0_g1_i1.p1  ORF type:complete len:337 (-),score=53.95 TRINITY_DN5395_c0_g1_i1:62-1072(-)